MENKSLASRLFIKCISFEKKFKKFKQETEDVKLDTKKMEELKFTMGHFSNSALKNDYNMEINLFLYRFR